MNQVTTTVNFDEVVIFKHLVNGKVKECVHLRQWYKWVGLSSEKFARWSSDNLKEFEVDLDFIILESPLSRPEVGQIPAKEIIVFLNTAKELCMLARTQKGKLYRKYLIQRDEELSQVYQKLGEMDDEAITEFYIKVAQEKLRLIRENKVLVEEVTALQITEEVYNDNFVLLMDWISAKFNVRVQYPNDISIGRVVSYKYVATYGRRANKKNNAYYYPVNFLEDISEVVKRHLTKIGYEVV